jgi:pyruvate kinase
MKNRLINITPRNYNTAIKIICTLGPASLNQHVIEKLTNRGVDYFRINMSHTSIEELVNHIDIIQKYSHVPICIDSEGAQVRTGVMPKESILKDRQKLTLVPGREMGNTEKLFLWPEIIIEKLKVGDIIAVDFDSALLMVNKILKNQVETTVINGGNIESNKAVTIFPSPNLPDLSKKDIKAINVGLEMGIRDYALSFANSAEAVASLRSIVGIESFIISKIESKKGVRNLDEILEITDAILIDRGDLSREVPLENIPLLQKLIIKKANSVTKPVYIATNLLESMMINRKPTRAELSDVMNTLLDGANGLVLAAETAIGKQPIPAVDMLRAIIERYNKSLNGYKIEDLLQYTSILLPDFHGVKDSHIYSPSSFTESTNYISGLDEIILNYETSLDVEQILNRVYSPLTGFMLKEELNSVLDYYKLPNNDVWTLPIILQVPERKWKQLKHGMSVALKKSGSEAAIAIMHIKDMYIMDMDDVSQKWFGTTDPKHPGVERFMRLGKYVVGGKLKNLTTKKLFKSQYNLTPSQTKIIFAIKGWSKILAFHSRNVPHMAHEFVMQEALKKCHADGLFIHPVVGPKKKGDFLPEVILKSYDILIAEAMPRAVLGTFLTYSRYSGPREAVFTALCRKNYGCTHFVVGRDHTGVGDFYSEDASKDLFNKLGDIGINPVFMDKVSYDMSLGKMFEGSSTQINHENVFSISGTEARKYLLNKQPLPSWYMRESIINYLRNILKTGESIFIK